MFPDDPATRDCRTLLAMIGFLALSGAAPAFVAGLLAGPHMLFAGVGLLGVAAVAAGLAWGLDRASAVARWGTRAVGVVLSVAAAVDVVRETTAGDYGAAAGLLFPLTVGGTLAVRAMKLPVRPG